MTGTFDNDPVDVKLTGSSTARQFIVVYDPTGGFVTGGGWIDSPAGAYAANLSLTGKANFGFVSKYQKGANKPTGESRTWPNELIREAVRGMEASRLQTRAVHNAILPFTRFLAGHADYTRPR